MSALAPVETADPVGLAEVLPGRAGGHAQHHRRRHPRVGELVELAVQGAAGAGQPAPHTSLPVMIGASASTKTRVISSSRG